MTEEEKKVYEKFYYRLTFSESFWDIKDFTMNFQDALVLRRIIEKLKKENEDYKQLNQKLLNEREMDYINANYISKDKIREKMKEVKYLSTAGYEILKELLREE